MEIEVNLGMLNISISEDLKQYLISKVSSELNENPEELVKKIKKLQSLAAKTVKLVKEKDDVPLSEFLRLLDVSRVTLWRKVNKPEQLQPDECIKILKALKII
jgi:hypothetical protein